MSYLKVQPDGSAAAIPGTTVSLPAIIGYRVTYMQNGRPRLAQFRDTRGQKRNVFPNLTRATGAMRYLRSGTGPRIVPVYQGDKKGR